MVTTGAISRAKLQLNRHRQQTDTRFTGRMLSPNQQRQSTEGSNIIAYNLYTNNSGHSQPIWSLRLVYMHCSSITNQTWHNG